MSQHAYADNFIMIVCYGGHQLQHDLTLSPSVRGVACEARKSKWNSNVCLLTLPLKKLCIDTKASIAVPENKS